MATRVNVTLASNGEYWQAHYYDRHGQRRNKSLGRKKDLSKRMAQTMCDRLAAEFHANPGRANSGKAPRLGEYLDSYLISRTDLRPGSLYLQQLTARYLQEFFTADPRIDVISRYDARNWRVALARGDGRNKPIAEATVCQHVRNAKTIFNRAVEDDLIPLNPFDRLKGSAPEPDKDWHYVSRDDRRRLWTACRNVGWQMMLGLCRLAGLRRGEALAMKWSLIDWEKRRITIIAQKTGRRRVIPIDSELMALLALARDDQWRDDHVVSMHDVARNALIDRLHKICEKAGLAKWADAFQVLRRNCETDWAQKYPQYAVSDWIGHDIRVSGKYYLQILEELYERAAG